MIFSNFCVYLRAFELDDYTKTHSWREDEDILKGIVGKKYFVSSEYEKKWIHDTIFDKKSLKLAVCLKNTDEHIGNVYLNSIDYMNRNCEYGIIIGDKIYWGKGIGSEATLLMLHHAFYELGMIRVYSKQLHRNHSSIRLHEKCGFKKEGVLRKAVFKIGEYQDLSLMSILREDYDEMLKSENRS
ncbi:MAG: GNAT family protein [Methanolobus sp.]|jgi:RimJ/RimL family protein N-acetyltransferase|nr:GNAT family protein [Methanolobus sp.]